MHVALVFQSELIHRHNRRSASRKRGSPDSELTLLIIFREPICGINVKDAYITKNRVRKGLDALCDELSAKLLRIVQWEEIDMYA